MSVAGTAGGNDFWTAADAAELDVLVWALVADYAEHRQRCRSCRSDPDPGAPYPCPHLRAAIGEVVEWREARVLLSRAQALRRELEAA